MIADEKHYPDDHLDKGNEPHVHLVERQLCRQQLSFCSRLAMKGAPARAIQELAGHANLGTTQRYMHLSPAAVESAIWLLEEPIPVPAFGHIVETAST